MKLLIASTNPGKLREFRQLLCEPGGSIELCDLSQHSGIPTVEETGQTFAANAAIKAQAYAKHTSMWTLADDSGLVVDALDGKPGVHSARWAQMNNSGQGDADNNALLLRQLAYTPDDRRTARFVCALALSNPKGQIVIQVSDCVEGRILHQTRGTNGFGYDPLFQIDALGRTTAELPPQEKHEISHRGKALRRLRGLIDRLGLANPPV